MARSKILITGGAGFLGSHLAEACIDHGTQVRIFDILQPPAWTNRPEIEYIRGDIRDRIAVRAAVEGLDAVVHAAFASPRVALPIMREINAGGARKIASACLEAGVQRLVLISSTVVEREPRVHPFLRDSGLSAMDAYRETRTEAERIASEFADRGLSLAIVRPKTFVGPGRVSAFNIIFEWIRKGRPVLLMGSASAPYQLVEIRDMAEGIRLLTDSTAQGVFYFGADRFGTLRGDLAALIEHAATGSRLRFVPPALARGLLRAIELSGTATASELHYMSAWGRPSVADTSRAMRELGWKPRWSNREALANAYDWYARSMEENGSARSIHELPGPHRAMSRLIQKVLR